MSQHSRRPSLQSQRSHNTTTASVRPIPTGLEYSVNVATWGEAFDITDPEQVLYPPTINGYITMCLESYRHTYAGKQGESLLEAFLEDFSGWTMEIWKHAHRSACRQLREHLVLNGVWCKPAKGYSWASIFHALVQEDTLVPWTSAHEAARQVIIKEQEIKEAKRIAHEQKGKGAAHTLAPTTTLPVAPIVIAQAPATPTLHTQTMDPLPPTTGANNTPLGGPSYSSNPTNEPKPESTQRSAQPQTHAQQNAQHVPLVPHLLPMMVPTLRTSVDTEYRVTLPPDTNVPPYVRLPKPPHSGTRDYVRQIGDLSKVYLDNEKKYGGAEYEVFSDKLKIFYENCTRLGIPQGDETGYAVAFSLMLKDEAHQYYMTDIYGKDIEFWMMTAFMKSKFEVPESAQKYLSEWRSLTLQSVMSRKENADKDKLECLTLMVKKLSLIQRNLTPEYHSDKALRDVILSAVQGVPECAFAQYNPAPTTTALVSQLRSSIATTTTTRPSTAYLIDATESGDQYEDEVYYVDRQYRGSGGNRGRGYNGNSRGGSRGYSRGGVRGWGNRGNYGGSNRGGGNRTDRTDKRCFVCGELGHFSTQHNAEERKKSYDN
ncbi:uncharacterized protein L3040_008676 [Drepanopeziza brunnea f. sp. 'multigermtubi']|uniref:uncharacterized protein n=1 Tax=Drepanopeziza brunnea f. sp. 'multigermtubi' TaxID=698441 RepID=UPI00238C0868|nr:hypothetical protein L3040_008676 [Drepanopeziza brunnea f. sp. 'multigermtubi']